MKRKILLVILITTSLFIFSSAKSENDNSYKFIKTKFEIITSTNIHKMDLYTYINKFDINSLKKLCKIKKSQFTSGVFYFLVVFDNEENATFPKYPFTADFALEKEVQKHIKAIYTYNRLNGYSKLYYYKKNSYESSPQLEQI